MVAMMFTAGMLGGASVGIKFGDIDSAQILENEFHILVLKRVVNHLLSVLPPTAEELDINKVRTEVVEVLRKKYPNSRIELKD